MHLIESNEAETHFCDAAMNVIATALGMDSDQGWKIDLEWTDGNNSLREPRHPRQVK
jgi:uncharacterized membrane protein